MCVPEQPDREWQMIRGGPAELDIGHSFRCGNWRRWWRGRRRYRCRRRWYRCRRRRYRRRRRRYRRRCRRYRRRRYRCRRYRCRRRWYRRGCRRHRRRCCCRSLPYAHRLTTGVDQLDCAGIHIGEVELGSHRRRARAARVRAHSRWRSRPHTRPCTPIIVRQPRSAGHPSTVTPSAAFVLME